MRILTLLFLPVFAIAQNYQNPIIPGYYPDPSICKVDDNYYLVTSTFEYFPGVPIFTSKDLINWKQIGHVLTRRSQLPLEGCPASGGIYAPTLRFHNGTYYMVTTNTTGGGHFYVTAKDPAGPWSDPIWVDLPGIDPSLFWDDDGKVYFHCTGKGGVHQSEIDLATGKLLSEHKLLWTGTGGRYEEAPHMYKKDGWYYLMLAEGGTEYGHMVTMARGKSVWGPWESCPHNPILTHRDRGTHPIQCTGHADICEDEKGNWWMVFLAVRQAEFLHHHIGRETFLAPVEWKNEWPIVNKTGTVELEMAGREEVRQLHFQEQTEKFDSEELAYCWSFLRNPDSSLFDYGDGALSLQSAKPNLGSIGQQAWLGRRQQHLECSASVNLDFDPQDKEEAGLTVFMNERHHYEVFLRKGEVVVRRQIGSLSAEVASQKVTGSVQLVIHAKSPTMYELGYKQNGTYHPLAEGESRYLSSETSVGFTGVYFALYATSNGKVSKNKARFTQFEYRPR